MAREDQAYTPAEARQRRRPRELVAHRPRRHPQAGQDRYERGVPGGPELAAATTERRRFLISLAREKMGGVSRREQAEKAARLVEAFERSEVEPDVSPVMTAIGAAAEAPGRLLRSIGNVEGERNDLMRHQLQRSELADPEKPGVLERLTLGFYNPDQQLGQGDADEVMQQGERAGISADQLLGRVRDEGVPAREALARLLMQRRPPARRSGY